MSAQSALDAVERNVMRVDVMRPVLRGALAALWIGSGLAALRQESWLLDHVFQRAGVGSGGTKAALIAACLAQLAIGATLLTRWRPRLMMSVQLGVIGAYMVALTVAVPALWLKPFSPLLTGLPVLAAIAMLGTLERAR